MPRASRSHRRIERVTSAAEVGRSLPLRKLGAEVASLRQPKLAVARAQVPEIIQFGYFCAKISSDHFFAVAHVPLDVQAVFPTLAGPAIMT